MVLTTHSMEEAEALCDRWGLWGDWSGGELQQRQRWASSDRPDGTGPPILPTPAALTSSCCCCPLRPGLLRRLGIFVGGRLQCVGNPRDLVSRFGGYLSFTITTPPAQVGQPACTGAEALVQY